VSVVILGGLLLTLVYQHPPHGDRRTNGVTPSSTAAADVITSTTPVGYIATARASRLEVFDAPDSALASHTFDNPWQLENAPHATVPLVFLVLQERSDGWLKVLLPIRPNGSAGWVRPNDVTVSSTSYRITVSLGLRRLTLLDGEATVFEDSVAIGAPETPTPIGRFFIRALLRAPTPNSPYGPYAYGLSGYSETLEQFDGGDAEVGLHGNNDASVLGQAVSHGCIRLSNDRIEQLAAILPLGTPVDIAS
jgi:lipoprotein-anchoring transpeptidase ErfK/SrfK